MIGTHGKIKGRVDSEALEQRDQRRHPLAGPAQGVDINLEANADALKDAARAQGSRDKSAEALGRLCA